MSASTERAVVAACEAVTRRYTRGSSQARSFFGLRSTEPAPSVTAVDEVDLHVHAGEIVGVEGPSGSGKSTLLHLLAALETPTSGTVTVAGRRTESLSARARTRLRLDAVGIVFQRFHLLPALPARSNVAVPLVELGVSKRERRERAETMLERVGLGDRLGHRPGELSGGEQQRVAIARALITEPALLIADEPTGELDTATGRAITTLFEQIADEGTAVVVASHDGSTLAIADRVIELRDGARVDG